MRTLAGLLVFALLAPAAAAQPVPDVWKGRLMVERGNLVFYPCKVRARLAVVDETDGRELARLAREFDPGGSAGTFLDAFAFREKSRLRVVEIRRAHGEGPGCGEDLSKVFIRALGNEPFWNLVANDIMVLVRLLGDPQPAAFPLGALRREGDRIVVRGETDSSVIDFVAIPGQCRDTMSGAVFNYRAEMKFRRISVPEFTTYVGCAYLGDAAR